MTKAQNIHPVDEILAPAKLFFTGLQHVMVMYAGAVAVPLIIGGAAHLSTNVVAFLITADLLIAGVATLIQSLGVWKFGIRLPVIMGVSFAPVGTMVALAQSETLGLPAIFGSTIAAGLFAMLITPFFSRLLKYFPPLVTGTVITAIGLTLLPVAIHWSGGGHGVADFGAAKYLFLATVVLVAIIAINCFLKGFWINIAPLLGLAIGYVIAIPFGMVDLSGMAEKPMIAFVDPFHFGPPTFQISSIIAMCIVMAVILVESTGMFLALGEITGRPVHREQLQRGLWTDGLITFIAGFFNTFPHSSFSQNVGLVNMTGIRSRFVTLVSGLILIALSVFPKLAYVVASIPQAVLGGAGIVMFGMVASAGLKILHNSDLGERKNQLVVAISLGLAIIPLAAPDFFHALPAWTHTITHSGITLAAVCAIVLNYVFHHGPETSTADPAEAPEILE